ncbi:MAG: DUF937 domain-containing protein [Pseudomonadota bacterium]|nr:DUF937 domain-containing protein [Pseudomonadota bacterium]
MDLINILQQSGGIAAIAGQLGVSPQVAEAGAAALLPAIAGGFSKQADAAGGGERGLGSLIGMLGGLGGASLATNVLGPEPTDVDKGNDVLGQIFGSKDVSRTVATHASNQTGIDPALLKKMLPILAMLVAGYLSHRADGAQSQNEGGTLGGGGLGGMLGSVLGSVLGGQSSQSSSGMGGMLGGVLGSLLGGGTSKQGGNALDEIIGMAGKLTH